MKFFLTRFSKFSLFVISLFILAGCPTIPANKTVANWLAIFPEDLSLILSLKLDTTRQLLKNTLAKTQFYNNDVESLLNFTEKIYVGLRLEEESPPSIWLLLLGGYPSFLESVVGMSKDWEKVNALYPYWQHKKMGFRLCLPETYLILISTAEIEPLIKKAKESRTLALKEEVIKKIETFDIALLFPFGLDEKASDNLGLGIKSNIIEHLWLGGIKEKTDFNFAGVFTLAEGTNAEAFKKLLQFSLLAIIRNTDLKEAGEKFKKIKFNAEGSFVYVNDFYLSSTELENLLQALFSKGLEL